VKESFHTKKSAAWAAAAFVVKGERWPSWGVLHHLCKEKTTNSERRDNHLFGVVFLFWRSGFLVDSRQKIFFQQHKNKQQGFVVRKRTSAGWVDCFHVFGGRYCRERSEVQGHKLM